MCKECLLAETSKSERGVTIAVCGCEGLSALLIVTHRGFVSIPTSV